MRGPNLCLAKKRLAGYEVRVKMNSLNSGMRDKNFGGNGICSEGMRDCFKIDGKIRIENRKSTSYAGNCDSN